MCCSIIFKKLKTTRPIVEKWTKMHDICIHKAAYYIAFKNSVGEGY